MQYFPRLDGIRALAVIGVLITHFFWWNPTVAKIPLGGIGVRVFFVLSGFLITRILLDYRDRLPMKEAAKEFYFRRVLRLGPAFAIAISVSAALGIANMRNDWPIHVLYLSNFLVAFRGQWPPVGHLWSLAVEEQFYLVWFAVVVWLPRRYLLPSIFACLVIGPVFRFAVIGMAGIPSVLTPSVVDSLAMGAWLGWAFREQPRLFALFQSRALLFASIAALLVLGAVGGGADVVLFSVATNLMSAALISLAVGGRGFDWLCFPPLQALGKISYGVYLYHQFVPLVLAAYGLKLPHNVVGAIGLMLITIAVAAASWVIIERPALLLKNSARISRQLATSSL